jgi:uncharacterized protein (TIGR02246 family)
MNESQERSTPLAKCEKEPKADPMSSPAADNEARQWDVAFVEQKVAELLRTQQQESVDGFVSMFTPEAVWVTVHGRRPTGCDRIHGCTKRVLPGARRDSTARYEVVHGPFVRDDVAVVNARQRPITHDGEHLDGQPEGSPAVQRSKKQTALGRQGREH